MSDQNENRNHNPTNCSSQQIMENNCPPEVNTYSSSETEIPFLLENLKYVTLDENTITSQFPFTPSQINATYNKNDSECQKVPTHYSQCQSHLTMKDSSSQYNYENPLISPNPPLSNAIFNNSSDNQQSDNIPMSLKIIYSLPSFSKMSCLIILNIHALIFYENKGASLLLISFFTALARCIEIILKPLIAHWSDNSNFIMGRRKPFMLFGCGFYALFLIMLFAPTGRSMSSIGTSVYFGVFYVFFFIADTVCNIPYQALGPEMSRDTRQRESLYMVNYFFQYIGVLFASVAPVLIHKFLAPCDCSQCECSNQKDESSLLYTSVFLGLFFVISIMILSKFIKERKDYTNREEVSYFVPTLFRMINNAPFMKLLIPWICDATITQIFATMLPFYVQYVINPQKYCESKKINLNSEVCDVNNWIGAYIFVFFIFCIPFTLIWHWLVKHIGKKKAWQTYSLISIVTFSLFLICDEGMMLTMIFLSIINSFPASAGYLNDVFVSDIIDYDQFITGKRNEGIYVVFTSFTPKIVGIFAQSIPLTIMSLIGFLPSKNGVNYSQPPVVKEFIRFYFIAIPILIALFSFIIKIKYPIDSESKMNKLKNSINLQTTHSKNLMVTNDFYKIHNPIYNKTHIQIFHKDEIQYHTKIVADHFSNRKYLEAILKSDYNSVRNKLNLIIVSLLTIFISALTILLNTFKFLENKSLSLIPILCLFVITISLLLLIINVTRLQIINKVIDGKYNIDAKYLTLYIYQMKNTEEMVRDREDIYGEYDKLSEVSKYN